MNGHVLDPRPDTEIIIEQCEKTLPANFAGRILDLGTGSGCIILTLLKMFPNASGLAVDLSEDAIDVARSNANRLGETILSTTPLFNDGYSMLPNLMAKEAVDTFAANSQPYAFRPAIWTFLHFNIMKSPSP